MPVTLRSCSVSGQEGWPKPSAQFDPAWPAKFRRHSRPATSEKGHSRQLWGLRHWSGLLPNAAQPARVSSWHGGPRADFSFTMRAGRLDPKSVARPVEPVILEADVPWRPSLAKPIPGVRAAIMIYLKAVTTSSCPLPRTGRGSLPGAIGALRSELLLEEVAHRSPRALVGLLVIEDRRVERAVGLGVGEAVQGVAI